MFDDIEEQLNTKKEWKTMFYNYIRYGRRFGFKPNLSLFKKTLNCGGNV